MNVFKKFADERARFEHWYHQNQDLGPTYQLHRRSDGEYEAYFIQLHWEGWKARAELTVSRIT